MKSRLGRGAENIRSKFLVEIALFPALLGTPAILGAAHLQPATTEAWEDYVQSARTQMEQRAASRERYLWVDEAPERLAKVRAGEIVVSPVGPNPKKVSSGLVHHWIGATFVPNASLRDVLQVARDYTRYKDLYQPSVVDSKVIESGPDRDRFSMRLINKAALLKTAFDADYESNFVRLDEHRVYSFSRTTRVQQIDEYGLAEQHMLPEGSGNGVIWGLCGITRFMERDGGVYIEVEGIALSREIPVSLRWFVDPMVRRVSKSSLVVSLEETGKAVAERVEVANRKGPSEPFSHSGGQFLPGGEANPATH